MFWGALLEEKIHKLRIARIIYPFFRPREGGFAAIPPRSEARRPSAATFESSDSVQNQKRV